MKTMRWMAVTAAVVAGLWGAAPRAEAGDFRIAVSFPFFCATPPRDCPPPEPPPCRVWVPGHYEVREEKVWVPGVCERVWVPPTYKMVWDGCRPVRVVCRPGHYRAIEHPGRWECREVRVWVPGRHELANRPPVERHEYRGRGYGHGRAVVAARF